MVTPRCEVRVNPVALRVIRELRGVTTASLADKASVSRPYVSLIESGARSPRSDVVKRLAAALDVPVAAISLATSQ